MRDVEELIREGLGRLADEVGTAVPLARRARAGRRRRIRRLAAVGAAAVVLVVAGGLGVTLHGGGSNAAPSVSTPTGRTGLPPDGYRLEVWEDVGVYVPVGWGWGGAPGSCGVGPAVGADGHRLSGTERSDGVLQGYVGRPVAQTPRCPQSATRGRSSAMPFVWLGADVEPGSSDLGHGFVAETRRFGDTTVTVGSSDARQRRTILASAHLMTGGSCAARLASPPHAGGQTAAGSAPVAMTVCAYAPAPTSGYRLLYQDQLGAGPAKQLVDAVAAADPAGEFSCFGASGGEWALLRLASADGSRDYVVDLSCPSIADPTGLQHELTSADVLPWAVDGVNAVLHGSPLIDVPGRLIGQ